MPAIYASIQLTKREAVIIKHILFRMELEEFRNVSITLDQYELNDFCKALNAVTEAVDNSEFNEELKE